jgi:putative addiction module component (TIGR02574 family)
MKLADVPAIQSLSTEQKLQLVDELWTDIASAMESTPVSAMEKQLLSDRWAAYLSDPSAALSIEEFQQTLKSSRK